MCRWAVISLSAFTLAACNKGSAPSCPPPKAYPEPLTPTSLESAIDRLDACLQQQARILAVGPDQLRDVADAVTAACDGAVLIQAREYAKYAKQADKLEVAPDPEIDEARADARRSALVLVATARARQCPAP